MCLKTITFHSYTSEDTLKLKCLSVEYHTRILDSCVRKLNLSTEQTHQAGIVTTHSSPSQRAEQHLGAQELGNMLSGFISLIKGFHII